jgi:osmoprotectant transport system permease protein
VFRLRCYLLSIACILAFATGGSFGQEVAPAKVSDTSDQPPIQIGSKTFTESIILGEMARLIANEKGIEAIHKRDLGGTGMLWSALVAGDIDLYPEYTGTMLRQTFASENLETTADIHARLAKDNIAMTPPLGFDNTYAIGVRRDTAESLNLKTISDLKKHPELKFAIGNEFMDRDDGWKGLKQAYDLPHKNVKGLDHALAYQAIEKKSADVVDVYVTDPHIEMYDLVVLEDDQNFFPEYAAVIVYRMDMWQRAPQLIGWYHANAGKLNDKLMGQINTRVERDEVTESAAAAEALKEVYGLKIDVSQIQGRSDLVQRIFRRTLQHLYLVVVSLALALVISFPLGILAAKNQLAGQVIVGITEGIMTVPSLALLALIGALFGGMGLSTIGALPAIVALFLYSLLPIIRNTIAGLDGIPSAVRESAEAMGLSPMAKLWRIELPLAAPVILTGIKTTAVINVGFAALGGLIGAGGYGATIMTGIRLNSTALLLEGAIPAAILAIGVKYLFEFVERFVVSPGLRAKPTTG